MRESGWSLCCVIALGLALVLAEEDAPTHDLKTIDQPTDSKKEEYRSGAPKSIESVEEIGNSEVENLRRSDDELAISDETKRFLLGNLKDENIYLNSLKNAPQGQMYDQLPFDQNNPYTNEYQYDPMNVQNANQILTYNGVTDTESMSPNQVMVSGSQNLKFQLQRSGKDDVQGISANPESYSRLIPYNERIQLHKIPGANYLVRCSSEGELHNFWSSEYQCLVCACIRDNGMLRAVCASCAGCMAPRRDVVIPEYSTPTLPVEPVTVPAPFEEEVTCKPLPAGKPFENPLHPCQVCVCIESINAYGKPDVNIKCQENPQCVLPTDATVIPSIPDVPVPSPYCDKFPLNVVFPHPSDACKTCRCTEHVTQGLLEKQLTCLPNPDCSPEVEVITEPPIYEIPVESEIVPIYDIDTIKPSWTPVTVPPAPLTPPGPLPGPSPHDSCRPYIPNQPFQHPWDECQMCVCTEAFDKKHVTVEISCFTKKSCCVEPPFDVTIPATLPPAPYKPSGKLQFTDAVCEYKTFGVEFAHPKDPCNICTCELQGHLITPLCQRSSKPECQLIPVFPTVPVSLPDIIQGNPRLLPGSSSYNAGSSSSSSSQNKAIKNAFMSYQNPYGSTGMQVGSTHSSADQNYNQWNLQKYQRPGELGSGLNGQNLYRSQNVRSDNSYGQNLQRPGSSQYGPQYNNVQGSGYPNQGQGYQGGAYGQNYHPGSPGGQFNSYAQGYPGNQPGLMRPKEYISQAQASASASSAAAQSNSYGYVPGYPYPGYPGGPMKPGGMQFGQSSASSQSQAQASAQSAAKFQTRSGKPDDDKSAENEE